MNFLTSNHIAIGLEFKDKFEAIHVLSQRLAALENMDAAEFENSVSTREGQASTCLGSGLMIPHGELPQERGMHGLIALSSKGWNFETPDKQPIQCIVLLATPKGQAARHLSVLSAFANLFLNEQDLRDELLGAKSPQRVIELLNDERAKSISLALQDC